MSELKPCPFCGCEAKYEDVGTFGYRFRVECCNSNCSVFTYAYGGSCDEAKRKASLIWNRRTTRDIQDTQEEGDSE